LIRRILDPPDSGFNKLSTNPVTKNGFHSELMPPHLCNSYAAVPGHPFTPAAPGLLDIENITFFLCDTLPDGWIRDLAGESIHDTKLHLHEQAGRYLRQHLCG
jgi:hypothetical protein